MAEAKSGICRSLILTHQEWILFPEVSPVLLACRTLPRWIDTCRPQWRSRYTEPPHPSGPLHSHGKPRPVFHWRGSFVEKRDMIYNTRCCRCWIRYHIGLFCRSLHEDDIKKKKKVKYVYTYMHRYIFQDKRCFDFNFQIKYIYFKGICTHIFDRFLNQCVTLWQHQVSLECRVASAGQRNIEVDVSSIRSDVV